MATVAVLGMGLLGAGFTSNLLEKGHTVRVWNRTASKCAPLIALGAIHAETPAEAVRGADRVHLILAADSAVDAVIEAMGDAVDGPILDHSTNLPEKVAARSEQLWSRGVRYFHAPVFMSPSSAREATGLMLISGPEADITELRPALETMTGKLMYSGAQPAKAAGVKLIGNAMLFVLNTGMGDLFRMGAKTGVEAGEIVSLFESFAVGPAGMGQRILNSGTAPVGFELTMARKDVGLMAATGAELTLLPAIATAMDQAIEAGRGAEDFTSMERP